MGEVVYSVLSYKSYTVSFFHPNTFYILKGSGFLQFAGRF